MTNTTKTTHTDKPALELNGIATRAAGLYEYATGLDAAWQDEADQLSGTDVPALIAEIRRLKARVAELEGPAVHARAALAALCYDLEDPGSNALGALHRHASEVLHKAADMADPEPPEVSFFGDHGPAVAGWLRMLADRRAAASPTV
jgi:hypothetical protein